MRLGDIMLGLGDPLFVYPKMNRVCGSMNANILLTYLIQETGKRVGPDAWIAKESPRIEADTGLTYKQQVSARKFLVERGFIEECYDRITHTMFFSVNPPMIRRELARINKALDRKRHP